MSGRWVSLTVLACTRRCCCGLGIGDSIVPRSRFVTSFGIRVLTLFLTSSFAALFSGFLKSSRFV